MRIASSSASSSVSRIARCSGHLRHEIGHYYWPEPRRAERAGLEAFRALFGDERVSYEDALERHYSQGDTDWSGTHVSQYATMHPWEDWAETFAHYLHIDAGLVTAAVDRSGRRRAGPVSRPSGLDEAWARLDREMVQSWLGLTLALNAMARSIGQSDLYPFVLSPEVVEKLDFVHRCIGTAVDS